MYLQLFLSISVDPVGDRATEWKVVLQMTSFQQGILSKVGIVPCLLIELCDLRDHLYFKACNMVFSMCLPLSYSFIRFLRTVCLLFGYLLQIFFVLIAFFSIFAQFLLTGKEKFARMNKCT